LKSIKVSTGGSVFREYKFKYCFDGLYSKLTEIEEYGQNSIRYNSTVVYWGEGNSASAEETFSFISPNRESYLQIFADFNGDGKTDFISYPVKSSYTYLDKISLYLAESYYGDVYFLKQCDISLVEDFKGVVVGDFDGNGKMDVVRVALPPNGTYRYNYYMYDGTEFTYDYAGFNTDANTTAISGDFNGDGKFEILIKENQKLFDGNGNQIASGGITWGTDYVSCFPNNRYLCDLNGNGKTDILVMDGSGCRAYELNGSSFSQLASFNSTELKNNQFPYLGDFDGDGYTDILVQNNDMSVNYILFSTGLSFVKKTITNPGIAAKVEVGDLNRDGKSDIFFLTANSVTSTQPVQINTGIYNGTGFTISSYTSSMIDYTYFNTSIPNDYLVEVVDFDGDGRSEYCFTKYIDAYIIQKFNDHLHLQANSIIDGFNNRVQFEYSMMTDDYTCTTTGTPPSFPVVNKRLAIPLVTLMSSTTGETYSSTAFYYDQPRFHKQGKGFLGFGQIETYNYHQNRKTITDYGYNTYYYNVYPIKQEIKNYSGTTGISTVTFLNTYQYLGTKRIFPYIYRQVATDHLTGLAVTTNYTFNTADDGNPSAITETRGNLTTTTTNTWAAKGSSFKNRLTQVTVQRSGLQGTFSETTGFNYDNYGRLTSRTGFQGNSKAVTTAWSNFDVFGNPRTVTTTANNCPTITVTANYDATGRFVLNSTDITGTTSNQYDAFGRLTQTTAINGNVTSCQYDGFGRMILKTLPTGKTVSYARNWDINDSNGQTYRINISEQGAPSQSVWYNAAGQEVKNCVKGFSGDIYSKKEYNLKGQLYRSYLPGYGNSGTQYTEYTYDTYGRPSTVTSLAGATNYTYSGLNTTITRPDGTFRTTTLNTAGLIASVSDGGGTVSYAYNSLGQPVTVTAAGLTTGIAYDDRGYRTALDDPNQSNTVQYEYDAYGRLRSQTNARGQQTTMTYDAAGRLTEKNRPEGTLTYQYISSGNGKGQLDKILSDGTETNKYYYNSLGLVTQENERIDGTVYSTGYAYDTYGRLSQKTSPSGFSLLYAYNSDGYLTALRNGSDNTAIWQPTAINAFGQITGSTLGNGLTVTRTYNASDYTLENIALQDGGSILDEIDYTFSVQSGNLGIRNDLTHSRNETFGYDALNRFNSLSLNGATAQTMTYQANGNIVTKYDVGTYQYNNNHAVTGITDPAAGYAPPAMDIQYTSFDRTSQIEQGAKKLTLAYGAGQQRTLTKSYTGNTPDTIHVYAGNYEKIIDGNGSKEYDYIYSPDGLAAIAVKTGGTTTLYYAHADHLGSLRTLTDAGKNIASRYWYNAWGKRTRTTGSDITMRGYTGHEHLPEFGLINMNGRMYNPMLGRFLSADPFVQTPDFSQSFNRYSYCLNNPLLYTDPSGYKWWSWLLALIDPVSAITTVTVAGGTALVTGSALVTGTYAVASTTANVTAGTLLVSSMITLAGTLTSSSATSLAASGTLSSLDFTATVIKGFDNPTLAAQRLKHWARMEFQSLNAIAGTFRYDRSAKGIEWPLQVLNNLSAGEFFQDNVGNAVGHYLNMTGKIDESSYYQGRTIIRTNDNTLNRAVSLGHYVLGDNIALNPYDVGHEVGLFTHEFGHTYQSRITGPLYLLRYGLASVVDNEGLTEADADRRGSVNLGMQSNGATSRYTWWEFMGAPVLWPFMWMWNY
jgi:RHS repeat-associated protein